jgi:internalin A
MAGLKSQPWVVPHHLTNLQPTRRLSLLTIKLWERLESVLQEFSPKDFEALLPPASEEAITQCEKEIGLEFPEELRSAYLRHNGMGRLRPDGALSGCFFGGGDRWYAIEEVAPAWRMMSEVSEDLKADGDEEILFPAPAEWWDALAVQPMYWNKNWIPVGAMSSNPDQCIDLAPCPRGAFGQLIQLSGEGEPLLLAPSLNDWIDFVAKSFETGRFTADPQSGMWIDTLWGPHNRKSFSFYGWRSSGAAADTAPG